MLADALRFVANQAIASLFSALAGTHKETFSTAALSEGFNIGSDSGSEGGFWGNLMSAVGSYFSSSGGRASGGPVGPGTLYRVNENEPELLNFRNRTFLMMGSESGNVTPLRQGGGGTTIINNVNVQPTATRRTADQTATAIARKQRIAVARN